MWIFRLLIAFERQAPFLYGQTRSAALGRFRDDWHLAPWRWREVAQLTVVLLVLVGAVVGLSIAGAYSDGALAIGFFAGLGAVVGAGITLMLQLLWQRRR